MSSCKGLLLLQTLVWVSGTPFAAKGATATDPEAWGLLIDLGMLAPWEDLVRSASSDHRKRSCYTTAHQEMPFFSNITLYISWSHAPVKQPPRQGTGQMCHTPVSAERCFTWGICYTSDWGPSYGGLSGCPYLPRESKQDWELLKEGRCPQRLFASDQQMLLPSLTFTVLCDPQCLRRQCGCVRVHGCACVCDRATNLKLRATNLDSDKMRICAFLLLFVFETESHVLLCIHGSSWTLNKPPAPASRVLGL